jgi:hypothetical protein
VPDEYTRAVVALRLLCIASVTYKRPSQPARGRFNASSGSALVRPPHERLVPTEDDPVEHAKSARDLEYPAPDPSGDAPGSLRAAVRFMVRNRASIRAWREERAGRLATIARSLEPYAAWLASLAIATAAPLLVGSNLAFMAAFIDAAEWPDYMLVERYIRGFPIVGVIPDSGVFRPQVTPATVPMTDVQGMANVAWADTVISRVTHAAATATGSRLDVLRAVDTATIKEARKGHATGPRSRTYLDKLFGRGGWRPMIRFGVEQGSGSSAKVRAIDNAKSALINAASTLWETIVCITCEFPAIVAMLVWQECAALGIAMLAISLGLDDMTAAYRFVPTSQPWYTVFCIWRFGGKPGTAAHREHGLSRPVFYYLQGHNFGCTSSVINFNRTPELMVHMAALLLAVAVGHYFDDFMTVNLAAPSGAPGMSGQDALAFLFTTFGRPLEPDKHKPAAGSNVGLGVRINVAAAATLGWVILSPTWDRCEHILTTLRRARAQDYFPPGMASVVRGKCGYLLTAAYGRVGRACLQPLVQREYYDTARDFSAALVHMHDFLEALLPLLPPLTIPIAARTDPPVVVYTDASFAHDEHGAPASELGYLVFDPGLKGGPPEVLFSEWDVPPWMFALFSPDMQTYIMQCEVVAAIWVYFSMPRRFAGRRVIHFIDNTGALSAMIHGYASKLDCARMVNSFHLLCAALRMHVWFEWVPSKANGSDMPSRFREHGMYERFIACFPSAVPGPSVAPPVAAWVESAASLVDLLCAFSVRASP